MAEDGKPRDSMVGGIIIVVVLMVLPGGFFLAKGFVEVADRFASRTVHEATLLDTELSIGIAADAEDRYFVRGEIIGGEAFEVDDQRLYDMVNGRTPLPARVEVSRFTGRVLAVRSEAGEVDRIGGASSLRLGIVGLVLGCGILVVPFALPLRGAARKQAKAEGEPAPPIAWGALAVVFIATVATIGATLAWDLLRR